MRIEFFGRQVKTLVQKAAQIGRAISCVSDQFHTIAGGNDHALFDSGMGSEIAASIGQARFGDGKTLAYFEGRALVIHANDLISHEAANLWMVEK